MNRIVVYTQAWRSGSGLYAQGIVEGLAEAGYAVTFIAPAGEPGDPTSEIPMVRRVRPVRELTGPASRLRRSCYSAARVMAGLMALLAARRTSRRFVVSIPDPFVFSFWPLLLLRLSGAQVIFVCHDPEPHAWKLPARLRGLERAGYGAMYAIASKIVVLAAAGRAELGRVFDIPSSKIAVIPHGAFDLPSAGPIPNSRSLLLFGTIRRNKQVHLAIQGVEAARASNCLVKLVIAGGEDPDDRAYIEECRALAASCGDAIRLEVGYISDERVGVLLRECDALLLPYADFHSQSGVAVLSGMAARPVIAAPAGGISDLIDVGLAAVEISAPTDAAAIAAAILEFYRHTPEAWTRRAAQAREDLVEALSWSRIGQLLGDLFN